MSHSRFQSLQGLGKSLLKQWRIKKDPTGRNYYKKKKKKKKIENRGVAGEFLKAVYNSSCLFCSALSQVELIRATLVLSASRPLGLIFLFLYLCNAIFSLL